jgi:hypothetical protein
VILKVTFNISTLSCILEGSQMRKVAWIACGLVTAQLGMGCGDDDGVTDGGMTDGGMADGGSTDGGAMGGYRFPSRFDPAMSSVDYGGQVSRHVLLADLVGEMERIDEGVRTGSLAPTMVDEPGEVVARLDAFFRAGTLDLSTRALPALVAEGDMLCQADYTALGDRNLVAKVAGEDDSTDHRDWDGDEGGAPAFAGWTDATHLTVPAGGTIATPLGLVDALFATFEANVRACALVTADCPRDPDGEPLPLLVTEEGLHLGELVEKVLLGVIHFSQGTDDYLDDDVDGKGLRSDNTMPAEAGALYTALEHSWDEGFGYFGAAIDYADYTDEELAAAGGRPEYAHGYHDADGDGCVDVFSEINFAASVNAAKRDVGATTMIDLTGRAFDAFVRGRTLISETNGALEPAAFAMLQAERDSIVRAWEEAIAATAIHYVNEVLADLAACGTTEYAFVDHAKHWGELKGFALAFQFSPRSPFSTGAADFAALHAAIGDRPVLCAGDLAGYQSALGGAREALRAAYGFTNEDAEGW